MLECTNVHCPTILILQGRRPSGNRKHGIDITVRALNRTYTLPSHHRFSLVRFVLLHDQRTTRVRYKDRMPLLFVISYPGMYNLRYLDIITREQALSPSEGRKVLVSPTPDT